MRILGKRQKLKVVLHYVPAVIFFFFWLFVWRKKDAENAAFLGLLCIGAMLLGLLLDIIRKWVGDERRFAIAVAVVIFCCSLHFSMQGSLFLGILMTLTGVLVIVSGCFSRLQKKTISDRSAPTYRYGSHDFSVCLPLPSWTQRRKS